MQITEEQKKQLVGALIGAVVLLVVQGAAAMGIDVVLPRVMPPSVPAPVGAPVPAEGPMVGALSAGLNPYDCRAGASACLRSFYGRDIAVYSDDGSTSKWSLDGATGNVTSAGYERVGTYLVLTAGTTISVTNGGIITPTASYQPIQSAGTVTPTLAAASGYTAGTLLRLVNISATSIIIQDTGNQVFSGDITLGQYDSLLLMGDGTRWIQIATSNN